ncbi:MAG: hypothetical protein QOE86_1249 [Solirubrobacteraceae bacterium]|nr:hypothetical protein [Solirubrobacteraceae bacterium]
MSDDGAPAVVAYDGSEEARAAVQTAARLLAPRRPLLIATVWEAGMAALVLSPPGADGMGMTSMPADPAAVVALDRAQADHASAIAEDGAQIARELGAVAEAVPLVDEADPAATLIALADERDAAAIVVGSRGLGGFKARMHGSTTRKLMQGTHRPVLVVRLPG